MALRIPKEATKFTKALIPSVKHMKGVTIELACPDDDKEIRGAYFLPKIGKKDGYFYMVMVGSDDKYEYLSVKTTIEIRMCSLVELTYARNLFFENEDVIVQFIPSDAKRIVSLDRSTAMWHIPRDRAVPLPTDEEIGNKPNPRIILLNQ